MGKAFLITGVPGTGKTTLAAALCSKSGAALLDINKVAQALGLYSRTDPQDGAKVVRLHELEAELCSAIKSESKSRTVIAEGHLGCEMNLPVFRAIVLRCDPRQLRARLAARKYSAQKLSQNALSEALDYCTVMAEKNIGKRKVWELDTTGKTPAQVLAEAEKIIAGKARKKKQVSFPDALLAEAIEGEKIRHALGK